MTKKTCFLGTAKTTALAFCFLLTAAIFSQDKTNSFKFNASDSFLGSFESSLNHTTVYYNFSALKQSPWLFKPGCISLCDTDYQVVKSNMPSSKNEKSIALGTVMSSVVPGSGEFYGGELIKSIIFFGLEVAGWSTYAYLRHKGSQQTDQYESYADQYWSIRTYAHWLISQGFPGYAQINPNEQNLEILRVEINNCEQENSSQTLPEFKTEDFYDVIGKYSQFDGGWINMQQTPWLNYNNMRQQASNYFQYATDGIYFIILNHILSAADAALTVSAYNQKLSLQTGFRIHRIISPYTFQYENVPTFCMTVNF